MLVLIWIVTGLFAALSALVLLEAGRTGEGSIAALIPLAVLAAILLAMPRTVSTNAGGICQHRWLLQDRVIMWSEIAGMKRGRNTGATYVRGRNGGRPISFPPLLVGPARFESEGKRHIRGLDWEE